MLSKNLNVKKSSIIISNLLFIPEMYIIYLEKFRFPIYLSHPRSQFWQDYKLRI